MVFRIGSMSMAPSQLDTFAKFDSNHKTANLASHIQLFSLEKFGNPLHSFPTFNASSVSSLRPIYRGHIWIGSGDPLVAPKVTLNYFVTGVDRKVAAASFVLIKKIAAAPALQKYAPEEFMPGPQFQTEEELIRAAGDVGTTIFHPVGICKMGEISDKLAFVDIKLRLIGVYRLHLIGASECQRLRLVIPIHQPL